MKKLIRSNYLIALLLMVLPLFTFAQEDGNTFRDVDPPPAPINDYVIPFAVVAILIATFYFYKTNFKTDTK
ncbi:MAG: hypothetical protein ACOYBS_11960 [Flavobacterium sp.]